MPAPLLALMLAVTQPELAVAASPDSPSHIADTNKGRVETTLERIGNEPSLYRLRFWNRNEFPVRVDYRLMARDGDVGRVTSVVLRNAAAASSYQRTDNNWDRLDLVLPTGIDYTDVRIYDVVRGDVRDRIGSRVNSNGVTETYTEMEFIPFTSQTVITTADGTSVNNICPREPVIVRSAPAVPPAKPRPPTAQEIRERSMGLPKHDGSDGTAPPK